MSKSLTIESLNLSTSATRNAQIVTYKKFEFAVYVDGGGLDIITLGNINETGEISQELFNKIFDNNYASTGLVESIIKAGATIKPMKKSRGYFVYKINGDKELWKGKIEGQYSYRAGYVFDIENLDQAIDNAEEEMRCLMAEAN
jgi:hypothetical protein